MSVFPRSTVYILTFSIAATYSCGLTEPTRDGSPFQTDTTTYSIAQQPGEISVQMRVNYVNPSSQSTYLHRACGYGDEPARQLVRADAPETLVELGIQWCQTEVLRLPIEVPAGATYVDEFSLRAFGLATEDIAQENEGVFRLMYFVQTQNVVDGWNAVSLVPEVDRLSNEFQLIAIR